MKNETGLCFIVSSNYQLMMAYFIQLYLQQECFIISYSKNSHVSALAEKLFSTERSLVVPRLEKDFLSVFWGNKKILKQVSTFIKDQQPGKLIVFKDNDYVNAAGIEASVHLKTKVLMLQEGLGIYTKHRFNWKAYMIHSLLRLVGYPKIYSHVQAMHPEIKWIAVNDQQQFPEEKKKGRVILDLPSQLPPHDKLVELSQLIGLQINDQSSSKKTVLFLGQPLSEIGLVEAETEKKYLKKVISIIDDLDMELYIKPHPSENKKKYLTLSEKVQLCPEFIPAELLPLFMQFHSVLTASSSAGDNMYLNYNLPVFYLHHLTIHRPLDYKEKMKGTFVYSYKELADLIHNLTIHRDHKEEATGEELNRIYVEFVMRILSV
jgi:Alpha-2,8-polysialyltransferase (POLYST)